MINRSNGKSIDLNDLKNINETLVRLEIKSPEYSLKNDIIKSFTGLSGSALSAGGKIATGTVVYSGQSTPNQALASMIFSLLSFVANCVDFLTVPFGYLYKLYMKEKVPFNFSNNLKWILAGITLALAIISFTVVAAAPIISFISVGVSVATATYAFIRYFYDRNVLLNIIKAADVKIDSLCDDIREDMHRINEIHESLRLFVQNKSPDSEQVQLLLVILDRYHAQYSKHVDKLKSTYQEKLTLEKSFERFKSPMDLTLNSLKVVLAGAVLAGTILSLNPVTLPIGMPIIAAAALITLAALITQKIIEIVQKRIAYKRGLLDDSVVKIEINSTSSLIKSFKANSPEGRMDSAQKQSGDDVLHHDLQRESGNPLQAECEEDDNEIESVVFYNQSFIRKPLLQGDDVRMSYRH